MMNFEITTFVGVGSIRFGMTQQSVRRVLSGNPRSFRRYLNEPIPADLFTELGIIVYYKSTATVAAIELSRPSNPVFDGIALFSLSVEQARAFLWKKDPRLDVDEDGFMSHSMGVGAYVLEGEPTEHEPAKLISVIVFEEGYFAERSDAARAVCMERVRLCIDPFGKSSHEPAS